MYVYTHTQIYICNIYLNLNFKKHIHIETSYNISTNIYNFLLCMLNIKEKEKMSKRSKKEGKLISL